MKIEFNCVIRKVEVELSRLDDVKYTWSVINEFGIIFCFFFYSFFIYCGSESDTSIVHLNNYHKIGRIPLIYT